MTQGSESEKNELSVSPHLHVTVTCPVGDILSSRVTGNEAGDRSAVIYAETVATAAGKWMKGVVC